MVSEAMQNETAPGRGPRHQARVIARDDGQHTISCRSQLGCFRREGLFIWCRTCQQEHLVSWIEIAKIIALFATRQRP